MEKTTPQSSRRRFFGLAAAAGLAGASFAAFGGGGRHGEGRGEMSEERLDRFLQRLYDGVGATDAQKHKLEPIVKQAAKDLRPLREQAQQARRKGRELLTADTIDRGAIERARAEGIAAADASSKRFTQALTDVAEVLTPEQRRKLASRLGRRGRGGMHFG